MSTTINRSVLVNSIYLPDGLAQADMHNSSLSVSTCCCESGKERQNERTLSLLSLNPSQCVITCKESITDTFEQARVELLLEEDRWEQNFVHRVTCIGLSGFKCMEYGRLFFLSVKDSQSSLPSIAYPNLVSFTLFWLSQGVANAALICKTSRSDSHELPKMRHIVASIAKHSITSMYLCGSIIDLAMNATTIRQGKGDSDQDVISIAVVLVILDSISLFNELVYFSTPIFTKAKQVLAKKAFTGSFFSTGVVSRLEDEPVGKNITVLRSCASKVRSAFGFVALGVAGAITITSSSIHWHASRGSFSSEHIILVEKVLAVLLVLVILFGYVLRR